MDMLRAVPVQQGSIDNCYETFCICRACNQSVTFVLNYDYSVSGGADFPSIVLNNVGVDFSESISIIGTVDHPSTEIDPPKHLPDGVRSAFEEGARCLTVNCWNAATAMFRTTLDLATKNLLPTTGSVTASTRNSLATRLSWLFKNGKIPSDLEELSQCIREDGNDAVHDLSIKQADAKDIADFAYELLRAIYTIPEERRLKLMARQKRLQERGQ